MLKKLPKIDDLKKIDTYDVKNLDESMINTLKIYITGDEIEKFEQLKNLEEMTEDNFSQEEQYILNLLKIPEIKLELLCESFRIKSDYESIMNMIVYFENSLEEIKRLNSDMSPFLIVTLKVCNYINSITKKEQVEAFDLDLIDNTLRTIKKGEFSLLNYINYLCIQKPDFFSNCDITNIKKNSEDKNYFYNIKNLNKMLIKSIFEQNEK